MKEDPFRWWGSGDLVEGVSCGWLRGVNAWTGFVGVKEEGGIGRGLGI